MPERRANGGASTAGIRSENRSRTLNHTRMVSRLTGLRMRHTHDSSGTRGSIRACRSLYGAPPLSDFSAAWKLPMEYPFSFLSTA